MYLTIKLLESGGKIRSQVLNDLSKFMQVSELKTKIEVGEKKYLLCASFPDPLGYGYRLLEDPVLLTSFLECSIKSAM